MVHTDWNLKTTSSLYVEGNDSYKGFRELTVPTTADFEAYANKIWDGTQKAVCTQLWLNFGFMNETEAWNVVRRTGFPTVKFARDTQEASYPTPPDRLPYPSDESNYNKDNYEDKRAGMVCVYRLRRTSETRFTTTLVQVIKIDFADVSPWRSKWDAESQTFTDRSPWGNFIIDTDGNRLWAFVTRDVNHTTRFFCFDIPEVNKQALEVVKLTTADVERSFDIPYSWYLQGACFHDGKIYSTEGMGTEDNPTRIRVVDLENGIEDCVVDLFANQAKGAGVREAEFIDFSDGVCWYGDYKKINNSPTVYIYRISGI